MQCDLNVKLYCIMVANAVLCACFADAMAEKKARWAELENYGVARFKIRLEPRHGATNRIAQAVVKCDAESDSKWFCEIVSFSMPTNDVEEYSSWMYRKTQLIWYTISAQNTASSIESWRLLATFLAEMNAKRGPGDSAQFIRKHKEDWQKSHCLLTMEDWGQWRKAYLRAKRYRSIWGRAATDTKVAIEVLARELQPPQKKVLAEIILEHTGKFPDWYRDEKETPAK